MNIDTEDLQDEVRALKKSLEYANTRLKKARYGLVWLDIPEAFDRAVQNQLPILTEVKEKEIITDSSTPTHLLIEGDNYHTLTCLNYTHKGKIDVIYIDPPYNIGTTKGKDVFKYKDSRYVQEFPDGAPVPVDHPLKHSYWLSFMHKRLALAHNLLSDTGVAIIHIDENELYNLGLLLANRIFQEKNELGTIVWNKLNPKGDAKGVSAMHEYVLCYAKNKVSFLKLKNTLKRRKPNALKIISKANKLFGKIGKTVIPEEVNEVIKPFNYPQEIKQKFEIKYDLNVLNQEFQNWLLKQDFSSGEKMYKYIDKEGKVYRGVHMGWPNKKPAPADYFTPLLHPITHQECPVPDRGWRNPSATMKKLLGDLPPVYNPDGIVLKGEILFGKDHAKQPERKYKLEDNLLENTPSIFTYGGSDDKFFNEIGLDFPYAKPVDVAKYFISSIHPDPKIVLDFFAGSGTTMHAVLDLNKNENRSIQCILATNNENSICSEITYPRLEKAMRGYEVAGNGAKKGRNKLKREGLGGSLKYYKTSSVGNNNPLTITDDDRLALAREAGSMVAMAEKTHHREFSTEFYQIYREESKVTAIYFSEDLSHIGQFLNLLQDREEEEKVVYLFTWSDVTEFISIFKDIPDVQLKSMPQPMVETYRQLYKSIVQ